MILSVREGNSGILYLRENERTSRNHDEKVFVPNYDMDAAIELLREFQQLKQANGCQLKASYKVGLYNWYPAMVSYLFWQVFFPYVKYQPLISEYLKGERRFRWENKGTFRGFIDLLQSRHKSSAKLRIHYWLVKWNNRLVMRRNRVDLLYFSFGRDDFRTKEIRQTLVQLQTRFIEVVPQTSFLNMIRNMIGGGKDYYYGREPTRNRFRYSYDLNDLPFEKQRLFTAAIHAVERSVTSYLTEYADHEKALKKCEAHTFYGLDDVNGYIFPLLYACHTCGMRTIGHQHGAYVRRHVGYIMPGIERTEFTWFDKVIVWGEYWKDKLLKASRLYTPDFFFVGATKSTKRYSPSGSHSVPARNVLIPYEFLTNTFKVGQYIQKLIDLGYNVFFKPRPDEDLADQLDAYCLPVAYRERLTVVANLDDVTLQKIDIVAGTMTTLIYELLPCNKIVWILETEYRFLEDLTEEGLAELVHLEDISPPTTMQGKFLQTKPVDVETLFVDEPLAQTLRTHIING